MRVGPRISARIQLQEAEVGPTSGPIWHLWHLSHFRAELPDRGAVAGARQRGAQPPVVPGRRRAERVAEPVQPEGVLRGLEQQPGEVGQRVLRIVAVPAAAPRLLRRRR